MAIKSSSRSPLTDSGTRAPVTTSPVTVTLFDQALGDRDDDLRLDRLFGEPLLDRALYFGRKPSRDRYPAGERHADPAVLRDNLLRDRDAARTARYMLGRRCAEQAAAGRFPYRHHDGVADTDFRLRRLAEFLESRVKAFARRAAQRDDDVVIDVDQAEADQIVLDFLALDIAGGRPRRRQGRASRNEAGKQRDNRDSFHRPPTLVVRG